MVKHLRWRIEWMISMGMEWRYIYINNYIILHLIWVWTWVSLPQTSFRLDLHALSDMKPHSAILKKCHFVSLKCGTTIWGLFNVHHDFPIFSMTFPSKTIAFHGFSHVPRDVQLPPEFAQRGVRGASLGALRERPQKPKGRKQSVPMTSCRCCH